MKSLCWIKTTIPIEGEEEEKNAYNKGLNNADALPYKQANKKDMLWNFIVHMAMGEHHSPNVTSTIKEAQSRIVGNHAHVAEMSLLLFSVKTNQVKIDIIKIIHFES